MTGLPILLGLAGPDVAHAATGLRAGIESGALREDLIVPLGFGGAGLHLGAVASTPAGPGLLDLSGGLGLRLLSTRYGQAAASFGTTADVRWLGALSDKVGLGPAFVWDAHMNYLESWDDAHGYWVGSQWIGPALRVTQDLGGGPEIEVAFAVALAGAVGRPPEIRTEKQDPLKNVGFWLVGPTRGEQFVTVDELQVLNLDLSVLLGSPEPGHGRWTVGAETHLVRTTTPTLAVDLGFTAWVGRAWGNR
jgi:hypothetical protein